MKKYIILIIAVFYNFLRANMLFAAANIWAPKADFQGNERMAAVGFSIGSKGYMGMGSSDSITTKRDFWEYDPAVDTWTQKATFAGSGRTSPVGFSIGNKGYVGTGYGGNNIGYLNDFWEYDPIANTWTPKAGFEGTARYAAVGFSIGSKGYVGTGSDYQFKSTKDFWEYDPATDNWTKKADFGGISRDYATGFSIGSKGYIGTGKNKYSGYYNDFWEYDPATDNWTKKADFGGTARWAAVGFSIGNKGYIGTGENVSKYRDFWEYDPAIDTWTPKVDFGGTGRFVAVGFSIGNKGYIGTGSSASNYSISYKDFWEYESIESYPTVFFENDEVTVYQVSWPLRNIGQEIETLLAYKSLSLSIDLLVKAVLGVTGFGPVGTIKTIIDWYLLLLKIEDTTNDPIRIMPVGKNVSKPYSDGGKPHAKICDNGKISAMVFIDFLGTQKHWYNDSWESLYLRLSSFYNIGTIFDEKILLTAEQMRSLDPTKSYIVVPKWILDTGKTEGYYDPIFGAYALYEDLPYLHSSYGDQVNLHFDKSLCSKSLPWLSLLLGDPPPCPTISNGDFESGRTVWTEYSSNGVPNIFNTPGLPVAPHAGSWAAYLGGLDNEDGYIEQQVTVPATCPNLTYYHYIDSGDYCGWDSGHVRVGNFQVDSVDLCSAKNTNGWVKRSIDLSAYPGQTVSLRFRAITDTSLPSRWLIDDVSFRDTN